MGGCARCLHLQRYQSTRRQRRKLEGELLFYELPGKEPGITTDQEVERERMMVLVQQKKILDQEIPLLKKCMELAPEKPRDRRGSFVRTISGPL